MREVLKEQLPSKEDARVDSIVRLSEAYYLREMLVNNKVDNAIGLKFDLPRSITVITLWLGAPLGA